MIGAIGDRPAADGATSGGAVNTVCPASGSPTPTIRRPLGANVIVNASPYAAAQRSSAHGIASAHTSVCATAGIRGPAGSDVAGARPSAGGVLVALAIPPGASAAPRAPRAPAAAPLASA